MPKEAEFKRNAEDAERKAKNARGEHDREAYWKIAEGWRALLAQEQTRKARGGS